MPAKKKDDSIQFPPKFCVVSADLSFRRPGFAKFVCDISGDRPVITDVVTGFVDNKTATRKTTGEILNEITDYMVKFFPGESCFCPSYYVRERALDKYASSARQAVTLEQIFKVVGVTDAFLWRCFKREFCEVHPKTVKKNVTGDGLADKQKVADALSAYVGSREYTVDDESDALAIGVAFLIQNGILETVSAEKENDDGKEEDRPVSGRRRAPGRKSA